MRKTLLTLFALSMLTVMAVAQSYNYRYWVDSNAPTSSSATGQRTFEVDISSLSNGLHAMHVQALKGGKWSSVRTRYFLKATQSAATSARYWFDNDPSTMHINVATTGVINLDVSQLGVGLHAVHYQLLGGNGPSAVRTRYFLKATQNASTSARYWFDNDLTTLHNGVATSGAIDLDISKVGVGLHAVHYQMMGADGTPSPVRTRYFIIDRVHLGLLTADISIDDGETTNYALTGEDIVIDIGELSEGSHTLHVKLLDYTGSILGEQTNVFKNGLFVVTGDTNGDGVINGTDLVVLVSMILGQLEENSAADVNGDNLVNGTDYVALVDMVLNASNGQDGAVLARQMNDTQSTVTVETVADDAENGCAMNISLNNPNMDVTLFQFDMTLPQGMRLKSTGDDYDISMTARTTLKSHSLYVNDRDDNSVRVLLASGKNALIAGQEGTILRLSFEADDNFEGGDVMFHNFLVTSPTWQENHPLPICLQLSKGTFTAIRDIVSEESTRTVYSLSGQRLSKARKGINIISGKKIIVK